MKRLVDIIGSSTGLVVLSPILLLAALAIKVTSKGPVIFKMQMAGRGGKPFTVYKFRSMIANAVNEGLGYETSKADPRITKVGKFLRKYAIDELPQLLNVLKGEMSLVGPRPTFTFVAAKYDEREKRRLQVKPGMTGLAQIRGRNELSWPERIEHDLEYVDNYSIWLDIRIILLTVPRLLFASGVYGKDGTVRMHKPLDDKRGEN